MENHEIINSKECITNALEQIASSLNKTRNCANHKTLDYKDSTAYEHHTMNFSENDFGEDEKVNAIEAFLRDRNIQITTSLPEDATDELINSPSEFLGNNYDSLRELLVIIKRNMHRGGFIKLSIKDYTQKDTSNVSQFSTRLHEIAFLEQYKYFKSPQYLIIAKTTTLPTAQNFFSGKWIQRFGLRSVQGAIDVVSNELNKQLEFLYLLNPQVLLPNGKHFEFDLFFHVNNPFYWIEATSGDYQQHISKYSNMSKIVNPDIDHSIMVLTDIAPHASSALTSLFSMTVLSIAQLQEALIAIIRNDCHKQSGDP